MMLFSSSSDVLTDLQYLSLKFSTPASLASAAKILIEKSTEKRNCQFQVPFYFPRNETVLVFCFFRSFFLEEFH
jgi:hypothetical protein